MTKILITGGSGFIGKNLINHLLKENKNIKIYNISRTPVEGVVNLKLDENNLFDFDKLDNDFDYIIHTLALSSDRYCEDFDLVEKINIGYTKEILKFASKQNNLKKFVFFSTITLYDNGNIPPVKEDSSLNYTNSNYTFSKYIGEKYVNLFSKKYNFSSAILRLSNTYGPGQKYIDSPFLIPEKIYEGINKGQIIAQNGDPVRDFIYIEDAVSAISKITFSENNGVFNIGSGKGYKIEEVIKEIATQLDVEYSFKNATARGPLNFYCDNNLLKSKIDWDIQIGLKEGIEKTINFYKKNYE